MLSSTFRFVHQTSRERPRAASAAHGKRNQRPTSESTADGRASHTSNYDICVFISMCARTSARGKRHVTRGDICLTTSGTAAAADWPVLFIPPPPPQTLALQVNFMLMTCSFPFCLLPPAGVRNSNSPAT